MRRLGLLVILGLLVMGWHYFTDEEPPKWEVGACLMAYPKGVAGALDRTARPVVCKETHLGQVIAQAENRRGCPSRADGFVEVDEHDASDAVWCTLETRTTVLPPP